jgi:hypothetical protein
MQCHFDISVTSRSTLTLLNLFFKFERMGCEPIITLGMGSGGFIKFVSGPSKEEGALGRGTTLSTHPHTPEI